MAEDAHQAVLDAALIAAAQKVEHYEIASYGTARTFAQLLGHDDARLLEQRGGRRRNRRGIDAAGTRGSKKSGARKK